MTWQQLLDWVNDPTRTANELMLVCGALGLPTLGNLVARRARLRTHITGQTLADPIPNPAGATLVAITGAVPPPPPPPPTPPHLTVPDPLPHAVVGMPFSFVIDVIPVGTPITVNNLQAWESYDPATRRVNGTPGPGDVGAFAHEIIADNGGLTDVAWRDLYVDPALEIIEPAGPLPQATVNTPYHAQVEVNLPGATVDILGLQTWATFNGATGDIDGTPGPRDVGNRNLTIRATLPGRPPVTRPTTLQVLPEFSIAAATLHNGQEHAAYRAFSPVATGGVGPYTNWRIARGNFPHGMNVNPANGQFTGTPDRRGTYHFTLEATDANGTTAERDFTLTVDRAPVTPRPPIHIPGWVPWAAGIAAVLVAAFFFGSTIGSTIGGGLDKCGNIDGIQWSVPRGMHEAPNGDCVPNDTPPTSPTPGQQPGTTPGQQPSNTQPAPTLDNVVRVEPGGRIWMPNGNPPNGYETTFKAPTTGNMTRRWMGVNAVLLDSSGNQIAGMENNKLITLRPGETYTVRGGSTNGGFALEVAQ